MAIISRTFDDLTGEMLADEDVRVVQLSMEGELYEMHLSAASIARLLMRNPELAANARKITPQAVPRVRRVAPRKASAKKKHVGLVDEALLKMGHLQPEVTVLLRSCVSDAHAYTARKRLRHAGIELTLKNRRSLSGSSSTFVDVYMKVM